jgi:3-hydroxybutyryl-CoA dehydrogenase
MTVDLLNKGLASIDSFLTAGIEKGKVNKEIKRATLSRIKGTTNTKDLCDCDLIIEAVYEDMDLKKRVFTELDMICPKHTILASNTSAMSIIEMARVTGRQDKVVGLHFFNPVPKMKLLELARSIAVTQQTLETAKSFGESIGKTVVIVPDTPGFICNRLTMALYLEAIRMVERGQATPKDIDTALKLGRNWPVGPFEMMDNNLEMFLAGVNSVYQELQEPAYAPPLLLRKMVAAGFIGRKVGKGWYLYR